jgi:hypothetical protein
MRLPITPPRLVTGDDGVLQRKLKRGIGEHGDPFGPHVHHFGRGGRRIDGQGRSVTARARENFQAIDWDIYDRGAQPPTGTPPDLDIEAGFTLLRRSPTFRRILDTVLRAGWIIDQATPSLGPGSRGGSHSLAFDTSRRASFLARLVHAFGLADAHDTPLPAVDGSDEAQVHAAALFLLRRNARALLAHATVRDEILLAGGPDIGGPGLRGLQVEAYDVSRRQQVSADMLIEAIAYSVDGRMADKYEPSEGPLVARNLRAAFGPPPVGGRGTLSPELIRALDGLGKLARLTPGAVAREVGAPLAPRAAAWDNPHVIVSSASLSAGPFQWLEVRAPDSLDASGPIAASHTRVLLVPRTALTHLDMMSWYGPGVPHDLDVAGPALATTAYSFGDRELLVTYRADPTRAVFFLTLRDR